MGLRARGFWTVAVAAVVPAAIVAAGQPARDQRPVFRSGVDIVRLDVSVLDKARQPVRDLTPDDLTILVDGVAQPIVAFDPVVVPPPAAPPEVWGREIAPDVETNAVSAHRIFIIVMNDAHASADLFQFHTAKRVARRIIDHLGPQDLAAVLYTSPFTARYSQDLTRDRRKLLTAVEASRVGTSQPIGYGSYDRTLAEIIEYLQARPQNRSAIMVIGPPAGGRVKEALESGLLAPAERIVSQLRSTQLARIPLYWFDSSGLEAPGLERTDRPGMLRFVSRNRTLLGPAYIDDSGGRSILHRNNPEEQVEAVFEENSAYYLIGYRPTYPAGDGRARRLRIRVNRPDVDVYPTDRSITLPQTSDRTSRTSVLQSALADILPQSDLPLRITAAAFADTVSRTPHVSSIAVTVGMTPAAGILREDRLELLGKAYRVDGKEVASTRATARIDPAAASASVEMLSRLNLAPGRYLLRYSVSSEALGKAGSVYTSVDVPDFRKGLSMSGALVTRRATSHQSGTRPDPVVGSPTTERSFANTEQVSVQVWTYSDGKSLDGPSRVDAALLHADGTSLTLNVATSPATRFQGGLATRHAVDLPLDTLGPGSYLLTLRATGAPAAHERHVRFDVR